MVVLQALHLAHRLVVAGPRGREILNSAILATPSTTVGPVLTVLIRMFCALSSDPWASRTAGRCFTSRRTRPRWPFGARLGTEGVAAAGLRPSSPWEPGIDESHVFLSKLGLAVVKKSVACLPDAEG